MEPVLLFGAKAILSHLTTRGITICERTLNRWIREREFPARTENQRLIATRSEVDEWVDYAHRLLR